MVGIRLPKFNLTNKVIDLKKITVSFVSLLMITLTLVFSTYMFNDLRSYEFTNEDLDISFNPSARFNDLQVVDGLIQSSNGSAITGNTADIRFGTITISEDQFPPNTSKKVVEETVAKTLYSYLVGIGLRPGFVCGILGHISMETGLDPTSIESDYAGGVSRFIKSNYNVDYSDHSGSHGRITPYKEVLMKAFTREDFVPIFFGGYSFDLTKSVYTNADVKKAGYAIMPQIGLFSWTGVGATVPYKFAQDNNQDYFTVKFQLGYFMRRRKISNYNVNKQLDMKEALLMYQDSKDGELAGYDDVAKGAWTGLNRIGMWGKFYSVMDNSGPPNIKGLKRYERGKEIYNKSVKQGWVVDEELNKKLEEYMDSLYKK